jgi:hypothetical protein
VGYAVLGLQHRRKKPKFHISFLASRVLGSKLGRVVSFVHGTEQGAETVSWHNHQMPRVWATCRAFQMACGMGAVCAVFYSTDRVTQLLSRFSKSVMHGMHHTCNPIRAEAMVD